MLAHFSSEIHADAYGKNARPCFRPCMYCMVLHEKGKIHVCLVVKMKEKKEVNLFSNYFHTYTRIVAVKVYVIYSYLFCRDRWWLVVFSFPIIVTSEDIGQNYSKTHLNKCTVQRNPRIVKAFQVPIHCSTLIRLTIHLRWKWALAYLRCTFDVLKRHSTMKHFWRLNCSLLERTASPVADVFPLYFNPCLRGTTDPDSILLSLCAGMNPWLFSSWYSPHRARPGWSPSSPHWSQFQPRWCCCPEMVWTLI